MSFYQYICVSQKKSVPLSQKDNVHVAATMVKTYGKVLTKGQ